MYVDDTTLLDTVETREAVKHITTGPTREEFLDLRLREDFLELSRRAKDIGMLINNKKTQLLVISPQNGCITTASMVIGDARIDSVNSLKLVGFTFGQTLSVGAHVETIKLKFRAKVWMLYNLRRDGFKRKQLFKLYYCYLRSIVEYCSAVYHSLLNLAQEEALEKLHRHAIRICYGFDMDVEAIMVDNGIETLKARRIRRCDAFIKKSMANERFGQRWFQARPAEDRTLRRMSNF